MRFTLKDVIRAKLFWSAAKSLLGCVAASVVVLLIVMCMNFAMLKFIGGIAFITGYGIYILLAIGDTKKG